jgi:T-complex protein 1 subunit theta
VKSIVDAGVNCVIVGGNITEIMKHYLEKYKVMIIRIMSKWELRRLAKSLKAKIITRLGPPTPEEVGCCDAIVVEEVGSQKIIKFTTNDDDNSYSTIVLRGNTKNTLDDIERAIDDAVHVYECACNDGKFSPGAGSIEIKLASALE